MKQFLLCLIISCLCCFSSIAQDSLNVTLLGQFNPGTHRYSGSWGYTSPSGQEFALLGGFDGLYIISIDDPVNPQQLGFFPGPGSNWREITVVGHHAFVVTEGVGPGTGMQVVDLSSLPDSTILVTSYSATFTSSHIIQKNIEGDHYVYVCGTNSTGGGMQILDISNPANPTLVGQYNPYYIHDVHVRGNRAYAAAIYNGTLDILDIGDRTNPQLIGQITYNPAFTHSSWTTKNHDYIFVTDEVDGYVARIFDISDLDNITEVATYTANILSLVHNPYIKDDFAYIAHNTEGFRVVDLTDPEVPVEVGYYPTWSGPSGGFQGLWSVYPFFPSGKIIGANRHDGLWIWSFNGARAGRFYGRATDLVTGAGIPNVQIEVYETAAAFNSDITGHFSYGTTPTDAQGLTVVFNAFGYLPRVLWNVQLQSGDALWLDVQMTPEGYTGIRETSADASPLLISNLVDEEIRIHPSLQLNSSAKAIVTDILGKEIFRVEDVFAGAVIPAQRLFSGFYIFSVLNLDGVNRIEKFLKR